MKTSDVLVTVPTRGSVRWETVTALSAARDYDGFPPILYQQGTLSVALTRNRIVDRFLERNHRVLAMVDDDVAPPINFVELMLPALDEFDMVAIPHVAPHAGDPSLLHLTAYEQTPDGLRPKGLWQGIQECDAVATGCVLIHDRVFVRLGRAPFRITDDPSAPLQSDDFLFCRDMKQADLRIAAYWNGDPADHFQTVSLTPLLLRQIGETEKQRELILP